MKCEICGLGPRNNVSIYRQNPYGDKGIWRCLKHNEASVDPDVEKLVNILEQQETTQ